MMMEDIYLAFFIALLLAAGVYSLFHVVHRINQQQLIDAMQEKEFRKAVDILYERMWTGHPSDEVAAWQRVVGYCETFYLPTEMQDEAKFRKLLCIYHGRSIRMGEHVPERTREKIIKAKPHLDKHTPTRY